MTGHHAPRSLRRRLVDAGGEAALTFVEERVIVVEALRRARLAFRGEPREQTRVAAMDFHGWLRESTDGLGTAAAARALNSFAGRAPQLERGVRAYLLIRAADAVPGALRYTRYAQRLGAVSEALAVLTLIEQHLGEVGVQSVVEYRRLLARALLDISPALALGELVGAREIAERHALETPRAEVSSDIVKTLVHGWGRATSWDLALELRNASVVALREADNVMSPNRRSMGLRFVGHFDSLSGRWDAASVGIQQSYEVARASGCPNELGYVIREDALLQRGQRMSPAGRERLAEQCAVAVHLVSQSGSPSGIAETERAHGLVLAQLGNPSAPVILGRAERALQRAGRRSPLPRAA